MIAKRLCHDTNYRGGSDETQLASPYKVIN